LREIRSGRRAIDLRIFICYPPLHVEITPSMEVAMRAAGRVSESAPGTGTGRIRPRHWLFGALVVVTILRWIYGSTVELSPDEAYYYMWSQRLAPAYYSKGPGVALAIRLTTAVFGANEFGVRFLSPLLALGTNLVVFFLARRIYTRGISAKDSPANAENVAVWTVIAMNAIPIFQVGALVMTIDSLSIFFWSAALWTFWLALERSPGFSVWWPLTGLCIGLGLLSKYTNAMQLPSVALLLATHRRFRGELLRPGFWSVLGIVAICAIPPVIWNYHHGWVTVSNLITRGHLDQGFGIHPLEWLSFFGAHLGVYSPLIFAGMLTALWWSRADLRTDFGTQYLLWFALPLLFMYSLLAINKAGQPNWTAPAFISLGVLASGKWSERAQASRRAGNFAVCALGLGIIMGLGITDMDITWRLTAPARRIFAYLPAPENAPWPWSRKALAGCHAFSMPYPYGFDPSARLHGWKDLASTVGQIRSQYEKDTARRPFLIASSYGVAAELSFYLADKRSELPGHPPVYLAESPVIENQFAFWPSYHAPGTDTTPGAANPFIGRGALFIAEGVDSGVPDSLENTFAHTKRIAVYQPLQHQSPLRTIHVFECQNYQRAAR
jgi:4-amino-4-deoxy-L-arabinose transferase-like glycosyltransferase